MSKFQISNSEQTSLDGYIYHSDATQFIANYETVSEYLLLELESNVVSGVYDYLNEQQSMYYDSLDNNKKSEYENQIKEWIKENYNYKMTAE